MTDAQARTLKVGDRIRVAGYPATVTKVKAYAGPLGKAGPFAIDFEFDAGSRGRASGGFIAEIERVSSGPPEWWNEVMG